MITLATAQNALKTVYLDVLSNQLNTNVNPLFSKIKQTSKDILGSEIRKLAPYGLNGGVGAGSEDGALPKAHGNSYLQFVAALKNLYGTIEISDKAVRSTGINAGAFVNLLNDEMENLIKSSSFNLARMLYGDGSGKLATVTSYNSTTKVLTLDNTYNFLQGMVVDIYTAEGTLLEEGLRVKNINRETRNVEFTICPSANITANSIIYVQGSKDKEITGLRKIFAADSELYGVNRVSNKWMNPVIKNNAGIEINDLIIQTAFDDAELAGGEQPDFIAASIVLRRAYQTYLAYKKRNIEIITLENGVKAVSFNGVPMVGDRFVADSEMYILNTKAFSLHQLSDWKWLEGENGNILSQKPGYPAYSATLVKYAELICDKPGAQTKITGLLTSVTE